MVILANLEVFGITIQLSWILLFFVCFAALAFFIYLLNILLVKPKARAGQRVWADIQEIEELEVAKKYIDSEISAIVKKRKNG